MRRAATQASYAGEDLTEIAEGILRFRLPVSFAPGHVNIYLHEHDGGWAAIDTGTNNAANRAAWSGLIERRPGGRRVKQIICTHFHYDHIGLAGWLSALCDAPLAMSAGTRAAAETLLSDPATTSTPDLIDAYRRHGIGEDVIEALAGRGQRYAQAVAPLPPDHLAMTDGAEWRLGGRRFRIVVAGGHAAGQVMLHAPDEKLIFVADQVLPGLSPNIGHWPYMRERNPLAEYFGSLASLAEGVDDGTLAMPGHGDGFMHLADRAGQIERSHRRRLAALVQACAERELSVADAVQRIYRRPLNVPSQALAVAETLSYAAYLVAENALAWQDDPDGRLRLRLR